MCSSEKDFNKKLLDFSLKHSLHQNFEVENCKTEQRKQKAQNDSLLETTGPKSKPKKQLAKLSGIKRHSPTAHCVASVENVHENSILSDSDVDHQDEDDKEEGEEEEDEIGDDDDVEDDHLSNESHSDEPEWTPSKLSKSSNSQTTRRSRPLISGSTKKSSKRKCGPNQTVVSILAAATATVSQTKLAKSTKLKGIKSHKIRDDHLSMPSTISTPSTSPGIDCDVKGGKNKKAQAKASNSQSSGRKAVISVWNKQTGRIYWDTSNESCPRWMMIEHKDVIETGYYVKTLKQMMELR